MPRLRQEVPALGVLHGGTGARWEEQHPGLGAPTARTVGALEGPLRPRPHDA